MNLKIIQNKCKESLAQLNRYRTSLALINSAILLPILIVDFKTIKVGEIMHSWFILWFFLSSMLAIGSIFLLSFSLYTLINSKIKKEQVGNTYPRNLFFDKKFNLIKNFSEIENLYKLNLVLSTIDSEFKQFLIPIETLKFNKKVITFNEPVPQSIEKQVKNSQYDLYIKMLNMLELLMNKLESYNNETIKKIELLTEKSLDEILSIMSPPPLEKTEEEKFLEKMNLVVENKSPQPLSLKL